MTKKRFQKTRIVDKWGGIYDSETDEVLDVNDVEHKLNDQQTTISQLRKMNEQLREINKEIGDDLYNCRLKKEELSKDIHKWSDGRYTLMFDEHTFFVWDNVKEERMTALETTKRLNEQQDTIFKLQDLCGESDGENAKLRIENKQLRQMIKENVFGRYREGSFADLEFKAIAYDDIVKLEMSNESEPKVIVICKQGKKENVKSFCQMFIPFGVHYEIKEGDDEIGRV